VAESGLVIAIDGPAGSGKSTTAQLVAAALGYLHVDTGAMYRAFTLKILRNAVRPDNQAAITRLLASTHVELRDVAGVLRVSLDGEDVSDHIRTPEVTKAVSAISSIKEVRAAMVREQRRLGSRGGIVLEGRDIGTVVFPDADLKIFLIASLEARAGRRKREMEARGTATTVDTLVREIHERDLQDSTRRESPLRKAADAIEIDTTDLTLEEQVARIVELARARDGGKRK
jgi:CMP/dCMP kinase